MFPLNAKKCEIAKIRPTVSGNFFQLVKIFYYFASEIFSCLLRGKTVKRNQKLANVCFDVLRKLCTAITQRRLMMTQILHLPLAHFFCITNHLSSEQQSFALANVDSRV